MKKLLFALTMGLFLLTACDNDKDVLVKINTEFGPMTVLLYNETPLHKKNFLELASEGRYDSTEWHRVMQGFMIQGGNVNAKEGTQESEDDRIPAELNTDFIHVRGALAAARQPDQVNPLKSSSSCQFYIVHGKVFSELELTTDQYALNQGLSTILADPNYDSIKMKFVALQQEGRFDDMNQLAFDYVELVEQETGKSLKKEIDPKRLQAYTTVGGAHHLDGEYTIFGRVVEGMEVIDKVAAVQVAGTKPVKTTYLSMELVPMSKKEITKKYGYEYPAVDK